MKKTFAEIIFTSPYLIVNKSLIKSIGLHNSIFLSNLIDKYTYFSKEGKLQEDGGFFITLENQTEQVDLSVRILRKCKKQLKEMAIIKTYMKGIPPKEFYIIDFEEIVNIIEEKYDRDIPIKSVRNKTIKSVRNIKENKYKENKERLLVKNPPSSNNNISDIKKLSPVRIKTIISEYNKIASSCNIPKVLQVSESRKKKIQSRAKSFNFYFVKKWKEMFEKIKDSDFLCGDNDRNWTITFDWIVNSDGNMTKLLEDNFKNKRKRVKTRVGGAKVIEGKYDNMGFKLVNGELIKK